MTKLRNPLLTVALAATLALSACGGSDSGGSSDGGSKDTVAAESSSSDDAPTDNGGAASSNPAVEEYCDNVDAYVVEMDKLISDPINADAAAIQAVADELAKTAADLAVAVEGADRDRFDECSIRFGSLGS